MVCYNPKIAYFKFHNEINDITGEITPKMRLHWGDKLQPTDEDTLVIPCGKCAGCRVNQASTWAVRCILEAQNWAKNCFLTLTYDNQHLPKNGVNKDDFQRFMKRLRKTTNQKIKYFAAGEYGLTTQRAHMHALLFNYEPEDLKIFKFNELKQPIYTSEKIKRLWGKGFITVGPVNAETAAYTARYCQKKAYKNLTPAGKNPEFLLTSRRPGLSANVFLNPNFWPKIKRNLGVFIPTANGVKLKPIPPYLRAKWREYNYQDYMETYSQKRANDKKNLAEKLKETSRDYWTILGDGIKKTKKCLTKLKRNL